MFHKIKNVTALPGMVISVHFLDGTTKLYDASSLPIRFSAFKELENPALFNSVEVDAGGYGIVWNDDLDLSSDELWKNGTLTETPFDGLMAFSEASELWGLSESALRKAISYGKIIPGIDARKYGKQWIISKEAMLREYGEPAIK